MKYVCDVCGWIYDEATGDEEFTGKVSRVVNIYSGADPYSGAEGGYTAEITIDSKGTNLLIGMNAKAKIILERSDDVIAVPYDAIDENDDGEIEFNVGNFIYHTDVKSISENEYLKLDAFYQAILIYLDAILFLGDLDA